MNNTPNPSLPQRRRSFLTRLLSAITLIPFLALALASGCATASRAGEVTITSPTAEQIVGPDFRIAWRPESRILTIVIHAEGNPTPTIKQYNKRSGETYRISTPGRYIVKAWTEGLALPEHEIWITVAAEDPATTAKTVKISSPENGAEVRGWFPVTWSESDLSLTVVFYHADSAIMKVRGVRPGTEFALPQLGLCEARFFVKDRKVPVASVWFTNKAAPIE